MGAVRASRRGGGGSKGRGAEAVSQALLSFPCLFPLHLFFLRSQGASPPPQGHQFPLLVPPPGASFSGSSRLHTCDSLTCIRTTLLAPRSGHLAHQCISGICTPNVLCFIEGTAIPGLLPWASLWKCRGQGMPSTAFPLSPGCSVLVAGGHPGLGGGQNRGRQTRWA